MTLRTKLLAVAGVIVVIASFAWRPIAEPRLVKFPSHLDRTLHYTGTAMVYVDAATGTVLASPAAQPLSVDRHLQTVPGGGARTVVIRETLTFFTGGRTLTEENQYVLDRRTMRNIRSPLSWAIVPSNVVDRSGSYSVNLPLGTDPARTYPLWKSEVGMTETLRADAAAPSRVSGVATVGLSATLPATPVIAAQQASLVAQGLPGALTGAQVQARVAAAGTDMAAATRTLASVLTPAQLTTVAALLAKPVPLHYVWSAAGVIAVNRPTGALVMVPSDTITVSVQPDMGGLGQLQPMLAAHAQAPGVAALQHQLAAIVGTPPQPVYRLAFSETAPSAAATAHTVSDQLTQLRIVRVYVPWGLLVLGAVLLAAAATTFIRRARPEVPETAPAPVEWPHAA
ncbi:MAG TPA: porin PorA family protein [Acidimicrobiales bacterium]|nr:porin PorA family protein [Acidimicrobiales bacterium]